MDATININTTTTSRYLLILCTLLQLVSYKCIVARAISITILPFIPCNLEIQ